MRKHVLILRLNVLIVIARCSNEVRKQLTWTVTPFGKKKGLPAEADNPLISYKILVPTAGFELAT